MRFHLVPLSLTWSGQIEVMHFSEGCDLEMLADTAKFIIKDGWKVRYMPFHLVLLTY